MPIRELPQEVVAQIAAGEVITRPGDVVKELLENAIDAILARPPLPLPSPPIGAVSVEIQDGGYARIRVADDGCGIAPEELPLTVRRHATSKIAAFDDLQELSSLGFRGEALAAISAVADLSIVSALPGAALGACLQVAAGEPGPTQPMARQRGTTVTAERLFERVPVRRKYQRPSSAETTYVARLVQAFALVYPEIAVTLASDGRRLIHTAGSGDLREAAASIFGPEVAREMISLHDEREVDDTTLGLVGLAGLVGSPELHRASRAAIFLSVNRRPVESRSLQFAIGEAYATLIPTGRHPVAVLDISVPPGEVDANVHPTKREVHLLRERLAFGVAREAVRATLAHAIGIPRWGERVGLATGSSDEETPIPMFPDGAARPPSGEDRPRLGGLRILGQVGLTYIICEGAAGLYLVDQHAAHERVLLERLQLDLGRRERTQLLLQPTAVSLPASLRGALDQYAEALNALGFAAEPFGEGEIVVRAVPAALPGRAIEQALGETLEALGTEGAGADWRERLAVLLSCKTAIKAGQHLEVAEMQALLQQLDEATLCATCSHGRPTAILLSHAELEREFGRR